MTRTLSFALLCGAVFAVPTQAETPLSGAEFETFSQGKTMTYARDGQVWGREQYLPGRRVIWAFEGEPCKRGTWDEPTPGQICFSYEDMPGDLECWQFFLDGPRLLARSDKLPSAEPLAAIENSPEPLICPGPDVGV